MEIAPIGFPDRLDVVYEGKTVVRGDSKASGLGRLWVSKALGAGRAGILLGSCCIGDVREAFGCLVLHRERVLSSRGKLSSCWRSGGYLKS